MPFNRNATRRYRIPHARYRVTNWPAYEAGLRRRGDLTLWLDEVVLAGWAAPKRSSPGGQPRYSELAIELVLALRLVFHLALRQTEAFMGWQKATGYGRRNRAETAMARYKHLIGPKLRARSLPAQKGEVAIAVAVLNTMIRTAKPVSVRIA